MTQTLKVYVGQLLENKNNVTTSCQLTFFVNQQCFTSDHAIRKNSGPLTIHLKVKKMV